MIFQNKESSNPYVKSEIILEKVWFKSIKADQELIIFGPFNIYNNEQFKRSTKKAIAYF